MTTAADQTTGKDEPKPKLEVPLTGRPKIPEWICKISEGKRPVLVKESDPIRQRIALKSQDGMIVIGRHESSCDVVIDSPSVSRRQSAFLFSKDEAIWICDLGSRNGTFIDQGKKLDPLVPTKIDLGATRMMFGEDGPWNLVIEEDEIKGPPTEKKRKRQSDAQEEDEKAEKGEPQRVRCAHILVKHSGSRNPSSWQTPDKKITRTEEQAIAHLRSLRMLMTNGARTFDEVAKTMSDCKSAQRGGDLGWFPRGKMQKPFEEAAFQLKVGQLSDLVRTDSGWHVILRLS